MNTAVHDHISQLQRAADTRSLYPPGHPSHQDAVSRAREVLTSLVNAEGKLDIGVMPDGMSINGEAIEDESGLVGDTATAWWKGGICGVLIQSLPSPEETEALLDALSSQDADAGETLVAQLDALESDAVRVATLEYDNLVPRAAMPGGALSDSTDLLRSLVDASAVTALTTDERTRLMAMLADQTHLTQAMHAAALPGGTGLPGTAGLDPNADEALLTIDGHAVEQFDESGIALATTLQRLAEIAVGEGLTPREAVAQLADAIRELDVAQLGAAYRADAVASTADFDVLAEIAKHFTVDEIVQIARSQRNAVQGEASVTFRRMLTRVAPTRERLAEVIPALHAALLDDGMSEDVFQSTLQLVMNEAVDAQPDETTIRGTDPKVREERRSELASGIEGLHSRDALRSRLNTCLELLGASLGSETFTKALDGLKTAWGQLPPDAQVDLRPSVTRALLSLAGPEGDIDADAAEQVRAVAGEMLCDFNPEDMLASLQSAGDETRSQTIEALASDHAGRQLLIGALATDSSVLSEADVRSVVEALIRAEEGGTDARSRFAHAIISPGCRFPVVAIDAIADVGGPVVQRGLTP